MAPGSPVPSCICWGPHSLAPWYPWSQAHVCWAPWSPSLWHCACAEVPGPCPHAIGIFRFLPACARSPSPQHEGRWTPACVCWGSSSPSIWHRGPQSPACMCTNVPCPCGIVLPCPHNTLSYTCRNSPVPISTVSVSLVPCSCAPVSQSLWQWCPLSPACACWAPAPCFCSIRVPAALPACAGVPCPHPHAIGVPSPLPVRAELPCPCPCDTGVLNPLPACAAIPHPCTCANGIPIPCPFPTMCNAPHRVPGSLPCPLLHVHAGTLSNGMVAKGSAPNPAVAVPSLSPIPWDAGWDERDAHRTQPSWGPFPPLPSSASYLIWPL